MGVSDQSIDSSRGVSDQSISLAIEVFRDISAQSIDRSMGVPVGYIIPGVYQPNLKVDISLYCPSIIDTCEV